MGLLPKRIRPAFCAGRRSVDRNARLTVASDRPAGAAEVPVRPVPQVRPDRQPDQPVLLPDRPLRPGRLPQDRRLQPDPLPDRLLRPDRLPLPDRRAVPRSWSCKNSNRLLQARARSPDLQLYSFVPSNSPQARADRAC